MRSRSLNRAALALGLTLTIAGCAPGDGTECGPGTVEIDGVCFAPDGGPLPADGGADGGAVSCPDSTRPVDLDDDGTPDACLPEAIVGDCAAPPLLEGPIQRDTVLAPGACFRVEGEVAITDGALLVLSAGVDIDFGAGAALTVDGGYLASLGSDDAPVRLHGGDAPGHWRGVRFAAASAIALESPPPAQRVSVTLPDSASFEPTVFEQAQSVSAFYTYRDASAQTGFEAVDRALVALHRDSGTGRLGLVVINGRQDPDQPRFAVEYRVEGLPEGARLAVLDDADSAVTWDADGVSIRQGARRNTDGFAFDGLPTDGDWQISLAMVANNGAPASNGGDGDGMTEWVFLAPDGSTTALPLGESITLSAAIEDAPPPPPAERAAFNVLRGVAIEHAEAGLALAANDVAVRLDGLALRQNTVGLDVSSPGARLRMTHSVLAENAEAAARITAWQLDGFQPGNRFEGAAANVFVRGGTLSADRVVPGDVPTVFTEVLQVTGGATLFAPAGAELVFGDKATLLLDGGRLVARGEGDRTLLRGANRVPGYWTGLRILNGGAIELDRVDLTDAGGDAGDGASAAIRALGAGGVTLIDTTVEDHDGLGLAIADPAGHLATRGATFSGGADIQASQIGGFGAGTTFGRFVRVRGGTWQGEGQLVAGFEYALDGSLTIAADAALGAEPGSVLRFGARASLDVRGGSLQLLGTAADPVFLVGDDWTGVGAFGGGPRSTLEHVRFQGATSAWPDQRRGAVAVRGPDVRLKLCNVDYGDALRAIDLAFEADIIDCDDTDICAEGGPADLCGVEPLPVTCGAGTEEVIAADGSLECRPDATACEDGAAFDEALRRCRAIEGGDLRCGEGTEQVEGECRPIDAGPAVICGAGTEEVIVDEQVECRPGAAACEDGEAFDPDLRRCRAVGPAMLICGAGTEEIDGECRPVADNLVCGEGTVRVGDACLPSVCGDGVVDAANAEECDGDADCNRFCQRVADAECLDDGDCGDGAICDLGRNVCAGGGAVFGPCEGPVVEYTPLVHPIAAETTLIAGNCYFVPDDTVVQDAILNIQEGVQLRFAADAALVFQGASVLNAQGTAAAPIVFNGVEPRPGYWQGVAFNVAGEALPGSVLRHVHLLNAGGQTFDANIQRYQRILGPYAIAALLVSGPVPTLDADGLRIEGSEAIGLAVRPTDDEAPGLRFADSVFIANAVDVALPAQEADVLVAPFAFSGPVEVFGSIAQPTTFRAGVPYRFTQQAHATNGARVVVEPGAVLRFEPDTSLSFGDATLIADGEPEAGILFDSTTPDTRWLGLGLQGGQGHVLRNLTIQRAGDGTFDRNIQRFPRVVNAVPANLVISVGTVEATVEDLSLIDGDGIGLQIIDHAADFGAGLRRLVVEGNAEGGAHVEPSGMGALLADGRWGDDQAVRVFGYGDDHQSIAQALLIHRDVPFEMQQSIAITNGAHVEVQPGARVRFVPGAGIVVDGGSLEARGRPGAPIVFESTTEESWRGISFFQNTLSDRNVLRHVHLDRAGVGFGQSLLGVPRILNSDAAISVMSDTARVSLGELTVTRYPVFGIRVEAPSPQVGGTLGRSHFESAVGLAALRLHANHASLVGPFVRFEPAPQGDNPEAPAAWVETFGEITRDTTMGPHVFWRVTDHLHVTRGATLSVLAGATVTFDETKGALMNGGFLRVLGTEEAPVLFTSRYAEPPFEDPGRWRGIGFFQNTDGDRNLLRHLVIEHAGDSSWDVSLESTPRIRGARPSAIDLISDTTRLRMHDVTLRTGSGLGIHTLLGLQVDDCSGVRIEYPAGSEVVTANAPITLRRLCRADTTILGPFPATDTIEEADLVFMSPVPTRGTIGVGESDRWFRLEPPGVGALLIDLQTGRPDQRVEVDRILQFESVEQAQADPAAGRVIFEQQPDLRRPAGTIAGAGRLTYRIPVAFGADDGTIDQNGGPVYVRVDEVGQGYVTYRAVFDHDAAQADCTADLECGFEEVCAGGACVDAVAEGFDEPNVGAGDPLRVVSADGSTLLEHSAGASVFLNVLPITTAGPIDVDPVDRYRVQVRPTRRTVTATLFAADAGLEMTLRDGDGAEVEARTAIAHAPADPDELLGHRLTMTWLDLPPGVYDVEVGATDFEAAVGYHLAVRHDSRPWLDCQDDPQACFAACGSNFDHLVIESLGGTGEMPGADICAVDVAPGGVNRLEAVFGPGEVCVNDRREPLCAAVTDDPGDLGPLDVDCETVLPLGRGGRLYVHPTRGLNFQAEDRPPVATITTANERTAEGDGYDLAGCNRDATCCVYVARHTPADDAPASVPIEWFVPANPQIIDGGDLEFE